MKLERAEPEIDGKGMKYINEQTERDARANEI
jgi:hypothetical protein